MATFLRCTDTRRRLIHQPHACLAYSFTTRRCNGSPFGREGNQLSRNHRKSAARPAAFTRRCMSYSRGYSRHQNNINSQYLGPRQKELGHREVIGWNNRPFRKIQHSPRVRCRQGFLSGKPQCRCKPAQRGVSRSR